MNFLELISTAIAPLVVLILGFLYKGLLEKVVSRFQAIKVKLPIGEISMSSAEAEEKLSELFAVFHSVYQDLLGEHERKLFREVSKMDRQLTVNELLPEFNREKEWLASELGKKQMGSLRAVRGLGLIEPIGGGKWQPDSKIEVTQFGKALKNYLKDYS